MQYFKLFNCYLKHIFLLSQASHRCLKHALQKGLVSFLTSSLATGDFTALKTFSKQIWTCSEPSSSTHKPCQACWPTCTTVLMTQPQLLDPSWPVSNQLRRGRSPAQMAVSQATETQPGQALPVSPCPHPKFPRGLSLTKKKAAFNNVQPIVYDFNVIKQVALFVSWCQHSFMSDSGKPASMDPLLEEKGTQLLLQEEAYMV